MTRARSYQFRRCCYCGEMRWPLLDSGEATPRTTQPMIEPEPGGFVAPGFSCPRWPLKSAARAAIELDRTPPCFPQTRVTYRAQPGRRQTRRIVNRDTPCVQRVPGCRASEFVGCGASLTVTVGHGDPGASTDIAPRVFGFKMIFCTLRIRWPRKPRKSR